MKKACMSTVRDPENGKPQGLRVRRSLTERKEETTPARPGLSMKKRVSRRGRRV